MVVDPFRVLLAQVLLLLYLREIGVEALFVALSVEGIHAGFALSLLLPDLVVFDLNEGE